MSEESEKEEASTDDAPLRHLLDWLDRQPPSEEREQIKLIVLFSPRAELERKHAEHMRQTVVDVARARVPGISRRHDAYGALEKMATAFDEQRTRHHAACGNAAYYREKFEALERRHQEYVNDTQKIDAEEEARRIAGGARPNETTGQALLRVRAKLDEVLTKNSLLQQELRQAQANQQSTQAGPT